MGFLTQEDREKLYSLEASRTKILMEIQEVLRPKSRAIWMECRDDNTKLFQSFAKGRDQNNTILELKKENNETSNTFEDLVEIGKKYFENIFKEDQQATIAEVIQISQCFPRSISEKDNLELMEEVSEEEVKATLHNFKKEKSLRPDGWTVEFLLAGYDSVGPDLLHLVEKTRKNGVLHLPLNSTFLTLIPKKESLERLEDYRPISLCNITYKVVTQIIAQRFRKVLSKIISKEQFGFLGVRQIHEAIGVAQEGLHSAKTKKSKGDNSKNRSLKGFR